MKARLGGEIGCSDVNTWQNSLFNVFVRLFGLDRAQNTIDHDQCSRN